MLISAPGSDMLNRKWAQGGEMALVDPVIVVPGITANYLDDIYRLPPETIWSVLTKDYQRAALHPDDLRFEAVEPALVRGGQLFEISYRELIEELRYNLKDHEDEPVPVFPFSYDWRQPLEAAASALGDFITEVISRTSLMKRYHKQGYGRDRNGRVSLIGHSMGGLVIAAHLQQARDKSRVGRVVTLATPYRGSFEAVIKITTGTANLGTEAPSSREREAARMTPALYYLLPDLPDAVEADGNISEDLFDPAAWQPSVIETIEEYIRLRGLDPGNRRRIAREIFAGILGSARQRRDSLKEFRPGHAGLTEDDWLCVVGADADTRVRLEIGGDRRAPEFRFRSADRRNRWNSDVPEERWETGDGTVPLRGAIPHFLPLEKIVCVRPDDFGYWEFADKAAMKFGGFHGILPNMDMLHRLIVRFLKDGEDRRGNTWGAPLPQVDPDAWEPPLRGGLRIRR